MAHWSRQQEGCSDWDIQETFSSVPSLAAALASGGRMGSMGEEEHVTWGICTSNSKKTCVHLVPVRQAHGKGGKEGERGVREKAPERPCVPCLLPSHLWSSVSAKSQNTFPSLSSVRESQGDPAPPSRPPFPPTQPSLCTKERRGRVFTPSLQLIMLQRGWGRGSGQLPGLHSR